MRSTSSLLRLLFVGITRATSWVYLSAVEGDEIPVLHDLAANAPEIVVQRRAVQGASSPDTDEEDDHEFGPVPVAEASLTSWL